MGQPAHTKSASRSTSLESFDLSAHPYLKRLHDLAPTYPALRSLLNKLTNVKDKGRALVDKRYAISSYAEPTSGVPSHTKPGRCAVVEFHASQALVETFQTPEALSDYFVKKPAEMAYQSTSNQQQHSAIDTGLGASRTDDENSPANTDPINKTATVPLKRLFILEDMEPEFIEMLGGNLKINPLILSEQMNTWNFVDSNSIPHRALPSMRTPATFLPLRYYEIRTLDDEDCVRTEKNQMTHAINRRKIERWRDVDLESIVPDKRHAFIRRCASFWASNDTDESVTRNIDTGADGWNAVILVDPPLDSCEKCKEHNEAQHAREKSPKDVQKDGIPTASCKPSCLMLEDPFMHPNRKALWNSRSWNLGPEGAKVIETRHNSTPYHGGCPSLVAPDLQDEIPPRRNMASPFDELVHYWSTCTSTKLLEAVQQRPINAAYFLIKFVAQYWNHQLDLIAYGVANGEWFSDDHEANFNAKSTLTSFKEDLGNISFATRDINYMRRQMSHFERVITLNMERLGMQLGNEGSDDRLPLALAHAQKDFLTIASRLRPFRERVDDLTSIANEIASLHAAYKSIQDGEQGLRLSLFASIIFPLTLVASMFSMSDRYRPGQPKHWVFWAASIPLTILVAASLMYEHEKRLLRWVGQRFFHDAGKPPKPAAKPKTLDRAPTIHEDV